MTLAPPPLSLDQILRENFRLAEFRPGQGAVCEAVAAGSDALVVMPTGAGKSLCYQVPGVFRTRSRGGTTLVISPLVALIEDQVQKLKTLGLRAERIHSGRERDDSRAAFRLYLQDELDFLFIAPERLAVPGFAEMLERKPPSLIAVDEAHCISQWGHDFRPDYRLVGERLGKLENTPIVALTATATPAVQDDIARQLGLEGECRFIHGFRRTNLIVEAAEMPPSARLDFIAQALAPDERRPAILYAPTRKRAEELAAGLKDRYSVGIYHAGLTPAAREGVQTGFLGGKLDVIVATVAFGMGIDKANVRTVIHAALPAAIESYYQEIGRAGRDGDLSRAILLHSFGDSKTHEFFLERDYPEVTHLRAVMKALAAGPLMKDGLQAMLDGKGISPEVFEKALEKLWIHGGVKITPDEEVTAVSPSWEKPYLAQLTHRQKSQRLMAEYPASGGCRMLHLIRHFGEHDSDAPCGLCDRCAPKNALSYRPARTMEPMERAIATAVLTSLAGRYGVAAGRLFEDSQSIASTKDRSVFERVLKSLEVGRFIEVQNDEFEKDGKTIAFRKIYLTRAGRSVKASELNSLEVAEAAPQSAQGALKTKKRKAKAAVAAFDSSGASAFDSALFDSLRSWRLDEARKRGLPAFRILGDRVLQALCALRPQSESDLLEVPGLGPKLVEKYGSDLLSRLSAR